MVSEKITEKGEWLTKGFGIAFLVMGIIIVGYVIVGVLL
jgi:hypothetical protein